MIFIPGAQGNKPKEIDLDEEETSPKTTCATSTLSETQFEGSNSRMPHAAEKCPTKTHWEWALMLPGSRNLNLSVQIRNYHIPIAKPRIQHKWGVTVLGCRHLNPIRNYHFPMITRQSTITPRTHPKCASTFPRYQSPNPDAPNRRTSTPTSEIALGVPELSKSQPEPSYS